MPLVGVLCIIFSKPVFCQSGNFYSVLNRMPSPYNNVKADYALWPAAYSVIAKSLSGGDFYYLPQITGEGLKLICIDLVFEVRLACANGHRRSKLMCSVELRVIQLPRSEFLMKILQWWDLSRMYFLCSKSYLTFYFLLRELNFILSSLPSVIQPIKI